MKNSAIMWLLTLCLTLLFDKVTAFQPPEFSDVLNYHKSVHLFYQDWLDNSYGKVNFTNRQKEYYNSLAPLRSPEIKILSLTNSNQDVGSMWSQIMSMFDGFHNNNYMDQYPRRYRRDAERQKLKKKGGPAWRRYLLYQRLNRLQKGKGDYNKKERAKKIHLLTKLIQRIDKKHPELSKPPKGNKKKGDESNKPTLPAFIEDVPTDPPFIFIPTDSNQKENEAPAKAPSMPVTKAPPTNKPAARHNPNSVDDNNDNAPPVPTFPEVPPTENIPTADPNSIDDIFRRRKRRHVLDSQQAVRRPDYNHLSEAESKEFLMALQQLLTTQFDGLSQYDLFVKSHRLLESPQAYSRDGSHMWNREFLYRFESALHQYNPSVQIPYLDLCGLLQQPGFDKISLWSELLDTPVIPECAWIGHTLQRKVVLSDVIINRLNTTLGCTRGSTTQLGMDQYADIHSLFGPCESGGSHLACPSCAVSDPIFWIIYADIDRRIGAMAN